MDLTIRINIYKENVKFEWITGISGWDEKKKKNHRSAWYEAKSHLWVVKFQGSQRSFGFVITFISIYWIHWMLEINRWSLGRAQHKTNHPTETQISIKAAWA